MGYFSNGSEGKRYQARYCDRCLHDANEDCPVLLAHLLYNYGASKEVKSILDLMIPRTDDGLGNERCKLFVDTGPPKDAA